MLVGTTIIGGNSSNRGGLFAVDAVSGKFKWTFRPTGTAAEANWPFGHVLPVDGGLWVDSYQALVKLQ